jgi:hypothetical protein
MATTPRFKISEVLDIEHKNDATGDGEQQARG